MLDKRELIAYWRNSSDQDYKTMLNLYASKDYHWSLFIGHLVIEKLLKAIYVKNSGSDNPPKSHDLMTIADKARLEMGEHQKDILDLITTLISVFGILIINLVFIKSVPKSILRLGSMRLRS